MSLLELGSLTALVDKGGLRFLRTSAKADHWTRWCRYGPSDSGQRGGPLRYPAATHHSGQDAVEREISDVRAGDFSSPVFFS
jgi:hypothetical protein